MTTKGTLCLGEVLVDLICERHVAGFADIDALVPHFGGATANVAISAARQGARVGLASAVGADPWGSWLCERLGDEGVDLTWCKRREDIATPIAVVVVNRDGEPSFSIYGEALASGIAALDGEIQQAVEEFGALFFGSNTLVGPRERAITEKARQAALDRGRPVIIDANLRLDRWPDPREAAQVVRGQVPNALLVRMNSFEAEILTGHSNPESAAGALRDLGAQAVVITLGSDGAFLAADHTATAPGVASEVRSTLGAGDAFTGVLVAALTAANYDLEALFEALPRAVAEGALAASRWGALER